MDSKEVCLHISICTNETGWSLAYLVLRGTFLNLPGTTSITHQANENNSAESSLTMKTIDLSHHLE